MSAPTPSLESTLPSLREAGYNITVVNGLLIVRDVPYVSQTRAIEFGVLAFPVETTDGVLSASGDHTAYFYGEQPYDEKGRPLDVVASTASFHIHGVGVARLYLSRKKLSDIGTPIPYATAAEKLETYLSVISTAAIRLDPSATARSYRVPTEIAEQTPFLYPDSASARVGVGHLNQVFERQVIGIIGLGGTGSYILDQVVKTSVPSIHLFDGGRFRSHTAFRAPGAFSANEVEGTEYKVEHYRRRYSLFRTGVEAHAHHVGQDHAELLRPMSFVFLAVDSVPARQELTRLLRELGIPYVDVGMGAEVVSQSTTSLVASVRTTFWAPGTGEEPVAEDLEVQGDDYSSNIQIAELNALNACHAVIRWKRHLGYYQDRVRERESIFNTNNHSLVTL